MRIGRGIVLAWAAACIATGTHAACPAANQYSHSFAGGTGTTQLSYTGGPYPYQASTPGGATAIYTVAFAANGITAATTVGTLPFIANTLNGGTGGRALVMGGSWGAAGRTPYGAGAGLAGSTRVLVTTLTFPTQVRDVDFIVSDIDYAEDQYRDWVRFVGVADNGTTYVGTATVPATTTTARVGPQTNNPVTIVAGEAFGFATANNATNAGSVAVTFPQPVRAIQIRYGNYPYSGVDNGGTGQQAYALLGVSWCPLPVVTTTKASAAWSDPINGTTRPKAIPGGDLVYTLTVTSAGSTVEAPVLTDALPAALTFFNGDMNDAGPGTANFEFDAGTSGLTLPASGISYQNAAGAAVTPAMGYDPAVRQLRIQPTGVMTANTSFAVRFRVRVN